MSRGRRRLDVDFRLPRLALSGAWEPGEAERQACWEMLVELSTRTSMAELPDDQGTMREALTSLHSLFGTTRDILRQGGPDVARTRRDGNLSFGTIAVRLLNDVLRPVLSEWHPRLAAHEATRPANVSPGEWERAWEHHAELRAAVASIRPVIRQYALVLAEAADVPELADAVLVPNGSTGYTPSSPGLLESVSAHRLGLGFRPQVQMVRWFGPRMLGVTAWRVARITLGKLDARRELRPRPLPAIDLVETAAGSAGDETPPADCWFDYAADLGDAFDPTMAVAWWMGRDAVEPGSFSAGMALHRLPDGGLPRGRFLMLGGDEIYPYPTPRRYENQMLGPYRLALPEGASSELLAIPGNHDWYDNLECFRRAFCEGGRIGGWATKQEASWFATRLPHGWWVWAIDTGLHGDINESQRDYFASIGRTMAPDDRVILCTPVPLWRLREKRKGSDVHDDLGRIEEFLAATLPPSIDVPVCLSGDAHIYAHYVQRAPSRDPADPSTRTVHHVTSGGAGAFLHPTHNLAAKVPQSENDPYAYQLREHWPPRSVSRHTLDASARELFLDRQGLALSIPFALVHALFVLCAVGLHNRSGQLRDLVTRPAAVAVALAVLAMFWLVVPAPNVHDRLVMRAARRTGFGHGLRQVVVLLVSGLAALALLHGDGWTARDGLVLAATSLLGGLVATTVLSQHLASVNRRWRIHDNMAFAGRHIRDYKHFVRCRIDADTGKLTLFVVGLDVIRRGWASALARHAVPPAGSLTLVDVIDVPKGPTA